jgi:hypothetical protein
MLRRALLSAPIVLALLVAASAPALAASDAAIADSAVLTANDVSAYGLTEVAPTDAPPPSGAVCKHIRVSQNAADRLPSAASEFQDAAGTLLKDRIIIYKSAKAARAAIGAYTDRSAGPCVKSALKRSLSENLKAGSTFEFTTRRDPLPYGDESTVYTIPITVTTPDGTVSKLYSGVALIRVGRGLAVLNVTAPGAPFSASRDVAQAISDRLTSKLAA